jgi:hypothetical protein
MANPIDDGWDKEAWVNDLLLKLQEECVALAQAVLYAGLRKAGPVSDDHFSFLASIQVSSGEGGAPGSMASDTTIKGALLPYLRLLKVCAAYVVLEGLEI